MAPAVSKKDGSFTCYEQTQAWVPQENLCKVEVMDFKEIVSNKKIM